MLKNELLNREGTKESTKYVHCIGFPGATIKDISEKIEAVVNTYYSIDMNNTFFISIGVNDTQIFKGKSKVSIDEYKNNISKIINTLKKKNCKNIFLGLTGIEEKDKQFLWKPDKYYSYDIIVNYNEVLKEICNINDIECIHMIDVLNNKDFIDGLHPNDNGYSKILERVLLAIEESMCD